MPKQILGFQLVDSDQGFRVADRSGSAIINLSPSAAFIWMQCNGTQTVESISQLICSAYGAEFNAVVDDVGHTLHAFHQSQLIAFCGSLAPEAGHRATFKPRTYHSNRGSVIEEILNKRGWSRAGEPDVAEFAMWAPGDRLGLGRTQSFEWFHTLQLRNKRLLHQNLKRANCLNIAPETYGDFEEFMQCPDILGDRLWFVKLSGSTHGRGVYCMSTVAEIEQKVMEFGDHTYVIQEGVADPVLHRGCKRTLRVYALVTGALDVYVYEQALFKTQTCTYDPASTSRQIQIDHSKAERRSSDGCESFPLLFPAICHIAHKTIMSVQDALLSADDPYRYQLFGLDFLVSQQRGPLLIEVNDWPTIGYENYAGDTAYVKPIKEGLLNDVVGLLLDGEPGRFRRLGP